MPRERQHLSVRGQVQGVGFRPFVYRLATELGLGGVVGNDSHGAWIEVEGDERALAAFVRRLRDESPPLARVHEVRSVRVAVRGQTDFTIVSSRRDGEQDVGVTPDAAVCGNCIREMFDPGDRRYRYPFINCTNCGPRYSIIESVPYDRPNTTMRRFRMCGLCQQEYEDPADRRFHAQPNACPACGPRLWLVDAGGTHIEGDPVRGAAELLRAGQIVAIKGIGGFHLACRADRDEPVERMRGLKARETKPFAVMVEGLAAAQALAEMDGPAARELETLERPIVLVPLKRRCGGADAPRLSRHVAPGSPHIGLMLPYAPLHHLLFGEGLPPLVMTSGNPAEEPLVCGNDEAMRRLRGLCDAFLLHDRDIRRRVDDSVIIAAGGSVVPIRRARGYAPSAVLLHRESPAPVLALGGELKTTLCVYHRREAILSEHLGDLKSPATYRHFLDTIDQLTRLLRVEPACIAHDQHPAYLSTQYALRQSRPRHAVQHHHAHIVGCMAENGVDGSVVGLACDGTGYGTDGAIWGCEILIADAADFRRAGHLRYFALPGGDAAAKETFRPAMSLLSDCGLPGTVDLAAGSGGDAGEGDFATIKQMLDRRVNCPSTSSLGRLFDAVAFLLGICDRNGHEAQAAMALEEAASSWCGLGPANGCPAAEAEAFPFSLEREDGMIVLDWRPMIRAIVAGITTGGDHREIAARFHETTAQMLAQGACAAAEKAGLTTVALSGGSFANQILLARTRGLLEAQGLTVLTHRRVPPGDGGLSLGQAVVAAARMERNA